MPALYAPLPASAQAAYSELFEALRFTTAHRTVADLHGTFSAKTVKGRRYWYFAFRDAIDRSVRQIYIGPDSPQLQALVMEAKSKPANQVQLQRQVKAAVVLGCAAIPGVHFRIIRLLEQSGIFLAGGVLVGSHAFAAFGNVLGVRWGQSAHTLDVDLDIGRPNDSVSLAMPGSVEVDVPSAIDSLKMGFVPHAALGGASYTSKSDVSLRIDFLTPEGRAGRSEFVESLKIPLQPLRFLEFVLEAPTQAALLDARGEVVLADIPDPARFAVHKLLVSRERPASEQAKARKDLGQAACLFDHYLDFNPDELVQVYQDGVARGPKWRKRINDGLTAMLRLHPDMQQRWEGAARLH